MKFVTLIAIVLLFGFLPCSAAMYQTDKGWEDLFNGKNLDGWKKLGGDAEFKVQDGVIKGISKVNTENTFLATEKMYGDFILEYEAKINPGLNAGVQIRSNSFPDFKGGRVYGYQVELDPSARAWTGGIYDESRYGWLYNLECNPKGKNAFREKDWNKFRVEAIGDNIRVWLNEVPVADLVDAMDSFGFIALQVHNILDDTSLEGKMVQYRNIRIKTENIYAEKTPASDVIPQISYLDNRLTEREIDEGWKLLWDGKTTNGWRGAKLENFPDDGWEIKDGLLTVLASDGSESTHGGDIVTIEKYENFILEVDFQFSEGANSGIKYFVDTELNLGEGSSIGCEFQILDDHLHPDARKGVDGNRTLASLYDLIPANAKMFSSTLPNKKRYNSYRWNRARIVVKGSKVQHYLNGIKVVEYERGTQQWKALVAYSKYSKWLNFGEAKSGHILLQDHGDKVSFKNIKIKELD